MQLFIYIPICLSPYPPTYLSTSLYHCQQYSLEVPLFIYVYICVYIFLSNLCICPQAIATQGLSFLAFLNLQWGYFEDALDG